MELFAAVLFLALAVVVAGWIGAALWLRTVARRQVELTPWVPYVDLTFTPPWCALFPTVIRIRRQPSLLVLGLGYLLTRALGHDPLAEASDEDVWLEARAMHRGIFGNTDYFDQRRNVGECPPSLVRASGPVAAIAPDDRNSSRVLSVRAKRRRQR